MTGYVRADVSNNISNGSTANADDLDLEFDALQAAFNASVGHNHNGAAGEGSPITVIGPIQDFIATASSLYPKNSSQYDLGTATFRYRDVWASRNGAFNGNLTVGGTITVTGTFTLGGETITATGVELNVLDGITATTAELNILDGVTSTTAELNLLDGVTATTAELNILDGVTATAAELNILDGAIVTTAELNYLDGVTSPLQTQINTLVAGAFSVTGAATTIIDDDLTFNRAVISNGSGKIAVSTATSTDLAAIAGINGIGAAGTIPVGGIIMWSGSIATVPAGWALCNGSNGTPDLRDRFIVGAGNTYAPGGTGGANTVTLATANLPAHTHTYSGTSSDSGNHEHLTLNQDNQGNFGGWVGQYAARNNTFGGSQNYTINGTDTTPSVARTTANGNHSHTFSGTTSSVGSGTAVENRPPYYALALIMKI